jgi:hypothetical protein
MELLPPKETVDPGGSADPSQKIQVPPPPTSGPWMQAND